MWQVLRAAHTLSQQPDHSRNPPSYRSPASRRPRTSPSYPLPRRTSLAAACTAAAVPLPSRRSTVAAAAAAQSLHTAAALGTAAPGAEAMGPASWLSLHRPVRQLRAACIGEPLVGSHSPSHPPNHIPRPPGRTSPPAPLLCRKLRPLVHHNLPLLPGHTPCSDRKPAAPPPPLPPRWSRHHSPGP